jgi:hypothetical protein
MIKVTTMKPIMFWIENYCYYGMAEVQLEDYG